MRRLLPRAASASTALLKEKEKTIWDFGCRNLCCAQVLHDIFAADLLAGITVGFVALTLVIAFDIASGVLSSGSVLCHGRRLRHFRFGRGFDAVGLWKMGFSHGLEAALPELHYRAEKSARSRYSSTVTGDPVAPISI